MNNPLKNIWCNRIEKMDGKDGFVVTKNSNVCHVHFATEDILGVPGGKRWRLRDAAVPIKADQSLKPCRKKQIKKPLEWILRIAMNCVDTIQDFWTVKD